jgi:hypothetical protein
MKKILMAILLVLMSTTAYAVESCVQSMIGDGSYKILQMVWTTDASGAFTATDTGYSMDGIVILAETIPSATAVPTDQYDIVLNNSSDIDAFGGSLEDRSSTTAEQTMPLLNGNYTGISVMGPLTLDVTNAGNSKSGTVRIHFITVK